MTYRVVQLAQGAEEAQVVTAGANTFVTGSPTVQVSYPGSFILKSS